MDLMAVMKRFPTQEACIAHLEKMRWGDEPKCPYCESKSVALKARKKTIRLGVGIVIYASLVLMFCLKQCLAARKCRYRSGPLQLR